MNKSNKLLSCLINALMICSFCYAMERKVAKTPEKNPEAAPAQISVKERVAAVLAREKEQQDAATTKKKSSPQPVAKPADQPSQRKLPSIPTPKPGPKTPVSAFAREEKDQDLGKKSLQWHEAEPSMVPKRIEAKPLEIPKEVEPATAQKDTPTVTQPIDLDAELKKTNKQITAQDKENKKLDKQISKLESEISKLKKKKSSSSKSKIAKLEKQIAKLEKKLETVQKGAIKGLENSGKFNLKKLALEMAQKKAPVTKKTKLTPAPALARKLAKPTRAAEIVKNILGVSEEEFVKMLPAERAKYLTVEMIDGKKVLFLKDPNNPNAPKVRVGTYTQPTGADLEARVAKKRAELKYKPRKGTSFSIVYKSGDDGAQHIDTGNMQADPAYKDAIFMVSSNFSGLETVGATDTPEGKAKKISDYFCDRTQGPSAAMSAAAGTVFRTYFANYERYPNDPSKWPQAVGDPTREVNFLRDLGIETRNGYITEIGAQKIDSLSGDEASTKFSYGFQDGVEVTHTGLIDSTNHRRLNDPNQTVNQMYVAALDIGQPSSALTKKLTDPKTPATEKQKIMDAAQRTLEMNYDAIIKEAFARGKTKVVLTRIGGGVFGNPPAMIDAAIKNALEKNKDLLEMGGIHVTLNAFGKANPTKAEAVASEQRMTSLVQQLGGTITEFGNKQQVTTTLPRQ